MKVFPVILPHFMFSSACSAARRTRLHQLNPVYPNYAAGVARRFAFDGFVFGASARRASCARVNAHLPAVTGVRTVPPARARMKWIRAHPFYKDRYGVCGLAAAFAARDAERGK